MYASSATNPSDASRHGETAPVRVGVIGQGRWGTRLAEALQTSSRYRLEALCDLRTDRLSSDLAVRLTQRVEDVLAAGLEAVFIATNPASHADLAVAALDSGHHVFVEKPCALSARDAERVCRAAERAGKVVGVGHLLRYHASYEKLVELVRSGALGETLGVIAERVGSRPRTDVDAWWMLAPHDLSVMLAMFGEPATELRRFRLGEDEFVASGHFGDVGVLLEARSGGAASRRFAVVGSRTTALFDDLADPSTICLVPTRTSSLRQRLFEGVAAGRRTVPESVGRALDAAFREPGEALLVPPGPMPLERELTAFALALCEGVPLMTDAREGLAVVRMLEAASREKRSVLPTGEVIRELPAAFEP